MFINRYTNCDFGIIVSLTTDCQIHNNVSTFESHSPVKIHSYCIDTNMYVLADTKHANKVFVVVVSTSNTQTFSLNLSG